MTRDRAVRNTRTSSKATRLGDERTKRPAFRNDRQTGKNKMKQTDVAAAILKLNSVD
jgi:hypothetical protein